jgi:peptide subunit release factor 1 (eRF1)
MAESQLADRLEALAHVEAPSFPLLSLYLNTDTNSTGPPSYTTFLRKELRERARTFTARSGERDSVDRDVERIESYVTRTLQPRTRGLVLFTCAAIDLFEAVEVEVPFDRNRLVVGDRPHLYPRARLDDQYPRYAALVVNTNLARIFVFSTGKTVAATQVQNPTTKHSKAGGLSQARFQRRVENVHLHHAKEVVARLDEIVTADGIDRVVVAGDEVMVPLLEAQLPERLARKLVDVLRLDIRSPEHQVLAATLEALQRKDGETDEAVVRDLIAEYRSGGLAVLGVEHVPAALRQGQVDTLIIAAAPEHLRGADEAANDLVTLAKQTSASLRFVENADALIAAGGVGASLRYLA